MIKKIIGYFMLILLGLSGLIFVLIETNSIGIFFLGLGVIAFIFLYLSIGAYLISDDDTRFSMRKFLKDKIPLKHKR
jgi:hypothetical protein